VVAESIEEAGAVCDRLAPEHLQVLTEDAETVAAGLRHYGGLFVGSTSAEVFGDYGIGPNHTLPTGGVARYKGGLSVFDFLRVRTWLRMDGGPGTAEMTADAAAMARLEGLEGHARAAELRSRVIPSD
jgi:histidinol dehydrogenase